MGRLRLLILYAAVLMPMVSAKECCSVVMAQAAQAAVSKAAAVITGPEKVEAGDLFILDSTQSQGEARTWAIPDELAGKVIEIDGKLIGATRTQGVYLFILAVGDAKPSVSITKHTLTVGVAPPPIPPPKPDDPVDPVNVPDDRFSNIGQRVAAKVVSSQADVSQRKDIGKVFETASDRLLLMGKPGGFLNVADASSWVDGELKKYPTYKQTIQLIYDDAKSRVGLSRDDTADWYRAVAVGLRGAK